MAKKFYGVKNGRKRGVYTSWADCQEQVIGVKSPLFRGFDTYEAAHEYAFGGVEVKPISMTNSLLKSNPTNETNEKHYNIYVDGSFDSYTKRYSWAFVVYEDDLHVIYQANGVGKDTASAIHNVAGELQATIEAVKWAINANVATITIHHDYIGISEWATGKWKANNPITQAYASFIRSHIHWVSFNKVEAHTGVIGNELVDKLAKEAFWEGFEPVLDVRSSNKYNRRILE